MNNYLGMDDIVFVKMEVIDNLAQRPRLSQKAWRETLLGNRTIEKNIFKFEHQQRRKTPHQQPNYSSVIIMRKNSVMMVCII